MMGAMAANASAMTQICIRFPAQVSKCGQITLGACSSGPQSLCAHDHLPWHASSFETLNTL